VRHFWARTPGLHACLVREDFTFLWQAGRVHDDHIEGWHADPYGRHEARWMSQGTPTSLVRDRGIESSDPVEDMPFGRTPVAVGTEGVHGGSDLRRSDDANRQPLPDIDRYKTMAFDTMARPARWPVPGVAADYDSPKESNRRFLGLGLVVLGVFAMIGGLYLIQTPTLPTHQFVPSAAELDVLRTGGTGTPPNCSGQIANSVSNEVYGAEVNPREANTEITVYPNSLVLIDGNSPEISANAPLCNLASSSSTGDGSAEVTYFAERPGVATIYFIDSDAHVSVAKIVVTGSTPPSSMSGWTVLVVGALAVLCGAVLIIRRKAWRSER
jgi:hypothetical protein